VYRSHKHHVCFWPWFVQYIPQVPCKVCSWLYVVSPGTSICTPVCIVACPTEWGKWKVLVQPDSDTRCRLGYMGRRLRHVWHVHELGCKHEWKWLSIQAYYKPELTDPYIGRWQIALLHPKIKNLYLRKLKELLCFSKFLQRLVARGRTMPSNQKACRIWILLSDSMAHKVDAVAIRSQLQELGKTLKNAILEECIVSKYTYGGGHSILHSFRFQWKFMQ